MAAQTLGIIDLYWGGNKIPIEKGGTVKLGGLRNKPVIVGRQVRRSQEMLQTEVDVTSVVEAGVSVLALLGSGEAEMQIHCDTGQTFTWASAFIEGAPEFSGDEGGKLKIKLVAGEPQELM
jgi:hypothetical protein